MNEPVEGLEMAETKELVLDAYRTNCPRGTRKIAVLRDADDLVGQQHNEIRFQVIHTAAFIVLHHFGIAVVRIGFIYIFSICPVIFV